MGTLYVVLLTGVLFGQFNNLSVTRDGSRVYFASSLRQRDTDQFLHPKIFMLDSGGITLVVQRERVGFNDTNAFELSQPQISGNGSVLVYAARTYCAGGSSCFYRELMSGTVTFADGRPEYSFGGRFRLSRNGRYLVRSSSSNVMPGGSTASLIDLSTGSTTDLTRVLSNFAPFAVSSSGAILMNLSSDRTFTLFQNEKRTLARGMAISADMDDAGATVVYETFNRRLTVISVTEQREWELGAPDRMNTQPSLSDDGQHVLYLSRIGDVDQVLFSHIDGSEWRQLTAFSEGIKEARLSGDGSTAYVVTGAGAILRIDTFNGATETLVGRTPQVDRILGATAPGSTNIIQGVSLATDSVAATPPLPTELGGLSVRIGNRPMLLQAVSPRSIVYQIPWELPVPSQPSQLANTAIVLSGGDPYFDAATPIALRSVSTTAFDQQTAAFHADTFLPVTPVNPGRSGETIAVYATGLGPVEPPVPSGQLTPSDPPSRITLPFQFTLSVPRGPDRPAEILFAGLTPGLIGIYQINVRLPVLPDILPGDYISLRVEFDGVSSALALIPLEYRAGYSPVHSATDHEVATR